MSVGLSLALTRRSFLQVSFATVVASALPSALRAAEPDEPKTVLAFDGNALLFARLGDLIRSDDGGDSWVALPHQLSPVLSLATHAKQPGRVVAGLASGGVAISEDGGQAWENRSQSLPQGEIDAVTIAANRTDVIYAAIRGDGLWMSDDSGQSWSFAMDRPWLEEAEHDLLSLASVDLASGMGGIWIYAGTGLGLTRVPDCFCRWQPVQSGDAMDALAANLPPASEAPLPSGEPVNGLVSAPASPDVLYAALPSGVWASQNGGVAWSRISPGPASAVAVHPIDAAHLIAVLDGAISESRDSGATWVALTTS